MRHRSLAFGIRARIRHPSLDVGRLRNSSETRIAHRSVGVVNSTDEPGIEHPSSVVGRSFESHSTTNQTSIYLHRPLSEQQCSI